MVDFATATACLVLGVNPTLIGAIIEVESQWNETAFNVNKWVGENYQNESAPMAAAAVEVFLKNGYTVDVGLMQINSENLKKYEVTVRDAFDICTNVQLGERIIYDAIEYANGKGLQGNEAIRAALSIYNTGNTENGISNGYVDKVWRHYYNKADHASYVSDTEVDMNVNTDMFDFSNALSVEVRYQ